MRKALGAVVFVIGIAGLGFWGAQSHAVDMQNKIRTASHQVAAGAIHPVDVTVSGRDITLTGLADTAEERDGLVAALDAIPGRRVVNADAVEVLPAIAPYETAIAKSADGTYAVTGFAPSAALASRVPGAEGLPLAHGAPDRWTEVMSAGHAALAPLDSGSFALTGSTLTLSGVAATSAEDDAARAALGTPTGFETVAAIDVIDPGIIDFTLSYDAAAGFGIDGTVPGNADVASALGLDQLDGKVGTTFAELPGLADRLAALRGLAGQFERFSLHGSNDGLALNGAVMAGLDLATVTAKVSEALGDTELTLSDATPPDEGAERVNAATGARQIAHGGNWLTLPDIDPTRATCTQTAMATVDAAPILFVTGSAELDPASLATLNDVAGIVLLCTQGEGMRVIVGGHTDAEGDEMANYSLSVARAKAVRDALVARGVPAAKLTAIGYGETEPVADNETEEGRAKNRRTTFDWPE